MAILKITDDIYLHPIQLGDASSIFNAIDSERERLRKWLFFIDDTKVLEDSNTYVQHVVNTKEVQYVIRYKGEFAGLIGFNSNDKFNNNAELGYWLLENYQGKGIIINSTKRLLDLGFNQLNLHRIRIDVSEDNTRSRKIPEKLGFTQEGIERESNKMCDGRYDNIVIYGLLKSEYNK